MRMSNYYVPTLKEDPADAEVISHRLMTRAGMIRKLTAGVYSFLPLGYRSLRKVEQIMREEMDAARALEVFLPTVQPGELWQESGRWELYGKELLRFKDRHDRECCLGPTHEEVITDLVRRDVRSYRDLPVTLYQIQTKFRDEVRPRFGLMRGREFIMKDAYSFDVDEKGADVSYSFMWQAYKNIFTRCGLKFRAVEADSGPIGGSFSHEFMVLAETGEDTIAACDFCDYAANMEKAEAISTVVIGASSGDSPEPVKPDLKKVNTPGAKTIEDVSQFLKVPHQELIKTLILVADSKPVAVLVRGDHDLNETKVKNYLKASELNFADPTVIQEVTGGPTGFSGPVGLKGITILADNAISTMSTAITGANEEDAHLTGVVPERDFHADYYGDFRCVVAGDPCPRCSGKIQLRRGIEVGHIFKLGMKYSEAMNARFLDQDGHERPMIMGCYGIGVGRTLAAAIEQNHDEDGIVFPPPLAPFTVIVTPVGAKDKDIEDAADHVYGELWANGIDTVLDDRDERPGVKFKDADLIGIPFRITIGKKALAQGKVELRNRKTKKMVLVDISGVVPAVKSGLEQWNVEEE